MLAAVLTCGTAAAADQPCRLQNAVVERDIAERTARLRGNEFCEYRRYAVGDWDGDGLDDLAVAFNVEGANGGGNNVGARAALTRGARHILLLNNDTEVVNPSFISSLLSALEEHPHAGIAGPLVRPANLRQVTDRTLPSGSTPLTLASVPGAPVTQSRNAP